MTDQFFVGAAALARLQTGPLGPHLETFAALLEERGYACSTIRHHLRCGTDFSEWLDRHRLSAADSDELRVAEFLSQQQKRGRRCQGARAALRLLIEYLRDIGVTPSVPPAVDDRPIHRVACGFAEYLRHERGLASATLLIYLPVVRRFLSERFGSGATVLDELRPRDVTRFVLRHARAGSPGRARLMVTALRAFFRFLYLRGQTATDLAASVPTVANWRLSELPKSLEPDEVERLLDACDQSTITGQRDYTILLLIARLGLRAGEVVAMELEDLNWRTGELIVRGKGARYDRLPLPWDVGGALVSYLRQGRPRCSTRRTFVRVRAPRRGFASSVAISSIVRRAVARAGLHPARKGAHLLRHSLAIRMLRRGASLSEIGEILRHRLPSTTEIYAKVDLSALRKLAQPWPGGEG